MDRLEGVVAPVDETWGEYWPAVQGLVRHLEDAAYSGPSPSEGRYYAWHPLPLIEFAEGMGVAKRALIAERRCWSGEERMLDVGSGIGTKLFLAKMLGWDAYGVERHLPYVAASRDLFPGLPVHEGDAEKFSEYAAFDLVYSYRLCVDDADWLELQRLISARMRPGALLFSAGGPDPDWLEHVGPSVWRI